jgi:hypothetical protein
MTRDPIGEAGGMNLYGFVGNDPVNRVDAWGRYGFDVHFTLTYKLARQAGFSVRDAMTIANADQGLDEGLTNPFFWPIGSTALHFMSRNEADIAVEQSVQQHNLKLLGQSLHMLQDSYSHFGYHAYPSFEIKDGRLRGTFGHIQDGHSPDKYCESSQRDTQMRSQTLSILRNYLNRDN